MYKPMHTCWSLVDTDQNIFVCRLFSLPSDIHRSKIYAYQRKQLIMSRTLFNFGNFRFLKNTVFEYLISVQKCTKGYIQPLYVDYVYLLIY